MKFYTAILRKSAGYWVALCLGNGLVGQGSTQDGAIYQLKEAIDSFQMVYQVEEDIYNAPVSIKDIHEFLTIEGKEPISEVFDLKAFSFIETKAVQGHGILKILV